MDGIACAALIRVLSRYGKRCPSGLAGSGWKNTGLPPGRRSASGSSKPRTPDSVLK
jgi:hypothetical protein